MGAVCNKRVTIASVESFSAVLGGADGEAPTVELPFDAKDRFGKARAPVRGTVNGTPFRTTVAVYGGRYLIGFNKELRAEAGIELGDEVEVKLERDDEPRVVEVPPELAAALADDGRRRPPSTPSRTPTGASTRSGSPKPNARTPGSGASQRRSRCCGRGPGPPSSAHLEAPEPRWRLLGLLHALHIGAPRSAAGPVDELLHRFRFAFEDRLHGPVGPVAHPPRYPEGGGAAAGRVAEEHSLDHPVDDHPATDLLTHRWQTPVAFR